MIPLVAPKDAGLQGKYQSRRGAVLTTQKTLQPLSVADVAGTFLTGASPGVISLFHYPDFET